METFAHQELKRLAIAFLRERGCHAVATEVRCPISRYHIDVAGFADRAPEHVHSTLAPSPPPRHGQARREPQTIIIECKQSRSDFLRDSERLDALLRLRAELEGIRRSIEEHRIKHHEPELRRGGGSLFAELDEWDFSASRLASYRAVLRRLRRLEQKVHGETKFFLIARYALADQLYLAAPRGMIRRCELPSEWGLLECPTRCLASHREDTRFDERPTLALRWEGTPRAAKPLHRMRLLRNIAVAASRAAQAHGAFDPVAAAGPDFHRRPTKRCSIFVHQTEPDSGGQALSGRRKT